MDFHWVMSAKRRDSPCNSFFLVLNHWLLLLSICSSLFTIWQHIFFFLMLLFFYYTFSICFSVVGNRWEGDRSWQSDKDRGKTEQEIDMSRNNTLKKEYAMSAKDIEGLCNANDNELLCPTALSLYYLILFFCSAQSKFKAGECEDYQYFANKVQISIECDCVHIIENVIHCKQTVTYI